MSSPVDWIRAEQIALRIAARQHSTEKQAGGRSNGSMSSADFVELAEIAEERVYATTGLRSSYGPATVHVIDRADWIRANIASFRGLVEPLLERLSGTSSSRSRLVGGPLAAASRQLAAAQLGTLLGWMSGRVLGQYDLLLGQSTESNQRQEGAVYLVGPNMTALEHRFGFAPDEFRLWVTLHELTHRAQFTGVPWMHEHFIGLVKRTLELAEPDPGQLLGALRDVARDRSAAQQRLRDGGLVAMIATTEQRGVFDQIGGLMSLLEGHGDVVMDRAGADLIPSASRFSLVLGERRRQANPLARLVQRLTGLEGKLNQYAAGERFIAAIEAVGGDRAVDRCWERVENLPSLDEIRSPDLWLDRVGTGQTVG